jgi:transposase
MKEIKNIFRDNNEHFKHIVSTYPLEHVLVTAIEVGKFECKALIVTMLGDVVAPEFALANSYEGYTLLKSKVQDTLKSTGAQLVIFGMEGTGHYHENLACRLKADGEDVRILHSADTRGARENRHAKNDTLDLHTIARMIITNKGRQGYLADGVYHALRTASRAHRKLIRMRTLLKNRITALVDRLFPGYWPRPEDALFADPWGKASLLILEKYPHPEQLLKLGEQRLVQFLKKHNTKLGLDTAQAVCRAARNALTRPSSDLATDALILHHWIALFHPLQHTIETIEQQMAGLLLQTPGLYLLSIPGIGVVYAADFTAEVGLITRFPSPAQLMSLAGNIPRVYDSAQYQSQGLPLSKHGVAYLRATLNQIALSLNTHCAQFTTYYGRKYQQKSDRPGIAKLATGNKFVRLAFSLMSHEKLFVPEGFDPALCPWATYYAEVFSQIVKKLAHYQLAPEQLKVEPNYFQKIKQHLEQTYGLNLNAPTS